MPLNDETTTAGQATGPALHTISIGDSPAAWAAGGFALTGEDQDEVVLGPIRIKLVGGAQRGFISWEFTELDRDGLIDGLPTVGTDNPGHAEVVHPNGVQSVDHVVIMSPDVERTVAALEGAGFEARRRRLIETATPPRQQVFLWAGPTILELVGPIDATSDEPASIWGLALVTDDIDASTTTIGEFASAPKTAVQPGRRIATLRTRALDISVTIALMTPHL